MVENNVEDGEESAPKSVDDSENASDGSEDISGNGYGNGDGFSHEDKKTLIMKTMRGNQKVKVRLEKWMMHLMLKKVNHLHY